MAERANREPPPRNPMVLSFAWLTVIGRLLRMRTFNTGGFGNSGGSGELALPWYCEQDEAHKIKWYPPSIGVPPCRIPEHLLEGGHKLSLDKELTKETYGILPDLKTLGL